jgi:hypothetical protein
VAEKKSPRPRRTRAHVIASQSANYVEKFFIDQGHTADRPAEDYGYDLLVNTFDEDGYAESGRIMIQLKAADGLAYSAGGDHVTVTVSAGHCRLWAAEPMPVFLVAYDAARARAYWLHVQEYLRSAPGRGPKARAKTVTFRVPTANVLSAATVDYARRAKARIVARIEGTIDHG